MKKLFVEFRDFFTRGNVIDLAIGVIIGTAFSAIVTSLVGDILSPVIGLVADTRLESLVWTVGKVQIGFGAFLTAILNFLLMALVLFAIVRTFGKMRALGQKVSKKGQAAEAAAPTTKLCPFCKTEIAIDATRCPHCTSHLEQA